VTRKSEYRTVNADLTAAIWAAGLEPVLETTDGITVEFVWPDPAAPAAERLAQAWGEGTLKVHARVLSQRARQLRTQMRKTCEAYIRERRTALRKKV
jgi:hypothetical protein